jgi:hypothetical protein
VAKTVAESFCKSVKATGFGTAVALEAQNASSAGITTDELGAIIGAGVPAFCPQYKAAEKKWDSSQ